jgi:hypothetical protein
MTKAQVKSEIDSLSSDQVKAKLADVKKMQYFLDYAETLLNERMEKVRMRYIYNKMEIPNIKIEEKK